MVRIKFFNDLTVFSVLLIEGVSLKEKQKHSTALIDAFDNTHSFITYAAMT